MPGRGVIGLDIGTSAVRAAEVTPASAKEQTTLHRFGQVGLPYGAVVNGEVVDIDAVAAAIRQLWTSVKFSSKKVVLGVANQKVVVRQVELPWLAEKEMRKALPFQVADVIPMPVEQALLDFHSVEEIHGEDGSRMRRVMLVAAVREMVTTSVEAVRRAGLATVMVDLTPFAVLRTLAGTGGSAVDGPAEALVDAGASITNVVVHRGGVPRFVRILALGGGEITGAVGERLGIPFEDAEIIKQGLQLSSEPGGPLTNEHPAQRAFDQSAGSWVEEVRGSLDYYLAQPDAVPLSRVVLSGGGARIPGLAQRLAYATRLPVTAANPMGMVRVGRTGLSPDQLAYVEPQVVVPLGLALGRAS